MFPPAPVQSDDHSGLILGGRPAAVGWDRSLNPQSLRDTDDSEAVTAAASAVVYGDGGV